jgi:DNA recombination protein RmuC
LVSMVVTFILGGAIAWLMAWFYFRSQRLGKKEVAAAYILREIHDQVQTQADIARDDLLEKEEELKVKDRRLAVQEQQILQLEDQLIRERQEIESLEKRFQLEFENVAGRLLEEKSRKFTAQNQEQLGKVLEPLREKIHEFEQGIERRFWEETKERVSLKKEIEQLRDLNQQLSQDANNLVNALRGENKTQGDWGEFRLELILERAGLFPDIHYRKQASFTDENGKQKRPDFIINLPEDKHIVIDAKVSLNAYERFFAEEDEEKQKQHLKAHLDSLRQHIRDLSKKNYQQLYQINSPDYLLIYIPLEPAYVLAVQSDQQLFLDALDKNIVLVTSSTLLATMRTVAFIWKQEKQKRSVLEIARQSGLLYDKFCAFVEDLRLIGSRLDQAHHAYGQAMNKLVDSKKFGDTLVGRAEKIRELGARTSRKLPKDLREQADEQSSLEETN